MIRESIVGGIILLFLLSSVSPMVIGSIDSQDSIHNFENIAVLVNNGSLSGYVNDSIRNPIEGVRVRVDFHEDYEESFSNELGYYHVTNIPECWCLKNVTVSKMGYNTEKVSLSISNNSIYDFILTHSNIIYVDDDGTADYTRIQNAIDNASDGDTVFVYSGTYYENIIINKSLILQGEDKNTTIIDSNYKGTVVNIIEDGIKIFGFTLKNSEFRYDKAVINVNSNNSIIQNNIITSDIDNGNNEGINLANSSNNHIIGNDISNNYNGGISIFYNSINNTIEKNYIHNTLLGSICIGWNSNQNIVIKNQIEDNICIILFDCLNNKITSNNIMTYCFGFLTVETSGNEITYNNLFMRFSKIPILRFVMSSNGTNIWDYNYWNRPRILPKPILGYYIDRYKIEFDLHPASKPYDIQILEVNV